MENISILQQTVLLEKLPYKIASFCRGVNAFVFYSKLVAPSNILIFSSHLNSSFIMEGNLEQGVTCIQKSILSLLDSPSWIMPRMSISVLCSLVSLTATFAQTELPYHAMHQEVISNDRLFFGDATYSQELVSLSNVLVHNVVDIISQRPSKVAQGMSALEACNCIASSFEVNHELSSLCSKLVETASLCLGADNKYLQSTITFVNKRSPLCEAGE